ncbi:ATP-binding protein [Thermopolyspora sp. NPDC052614]|uniref:sensor histidine kinase n=1 Tax=Thermopolyspora sp. NPDC052614 TaxID=3155682 RepID=UPI00341AF5FE
MRVAGVAGALVIAVLAVRLGVVLRAEEQWLAMYYSPPEITDEVTRLLVGVPVCVVAVFLLADRSGHRAGVLLAAGAVWIVPSAMFDLLASYGGGAAAEGTAMVLLGAIGIAGRPLTVLLLVLCLLGDPPLRRRHWVVVATAGAACGGHAAVWALSVPGAPPFFSPWSETAVSEWAAELLYPAQEILWWARWVVTVCVTAELVGRAVGTSGRRDRRVGALLAGAYPVCCFLLLSDVGGSVPTVAARAVGSIVWIAMICLMAARTGMWRLERATCHRLADTFVLTILAAVAVCAAVLVWAAFPSDGETMTFAVAGGAFVVGWIVRPIVRRTSLAVERAFYGPRARPHEAARALAVRLRLAPHPEDVPEQICRSVVEDLGLSGAVVEIDTRSGPRRLAAFGAPVTEPRQVFVLRHHGKVTGRLMVARDGASTPSERDTDLLSLLADQAGPALAALRLGEEAQAARERLVLAREEERRRLRREIHDGLGPQLAAVQLRLGIAQACGAVDSVASEQMSGQRSGQMSGQRSGQVSGRVSEQAEQASERLRLASEQLRLATDVLGEALTELRRITAGLTPAALVEHGLLVAMRTLAHRLSTDAVRITVTCADDSLPALPPAVETAAYRIAAEAVTNAVRHARAGRVEVVFAPCPGGLSVTVTDDGTGFDAEAVAGTGLGSIVERAEEIGGTSLIDSGPRGTIVSATLPIRPSTDLSGAPRLLPRITGTDLIGIGSDPITTGTGTITGNASDSPGNGAVVGAKIDICADGGARINPCVSAAALSGGGPAAISRITPVGTGTHTNSDKDHDE